MKKGISGLDTVLKNINKETVELKKAARRGLTVFGARIRREGQKETPMATGHLVNSWYGPEVDERVTSIIAEIGLTASYAPFVHEGVGKRFKRPGSKAKFLEDPLKRNADEFGPTIAIYIREVLD